MSKQANTYPKRAGGTRMARGRTGRAWAGRAWATALVVALLGTGLGACHHPSPPTGLADCYQGLPLAEAALNSPDRDYHFQGVRLVEPRAFERLVERRYPHSPHGTTLVTVRAGSRVCAFAFTGTFAAGQVAGSSPGTSGKAAIVLVTTDRRLLFSFVLARLPAHFSRPFAGA